MVDHTADAFASAQEFLARPPHPGPCCPVLDVKMPGLSGIRLQEVLAATGCRLSMVFVTGHADVPTSVGAYEGRRGRSAHQAGRRSGSHRRHSAVGERDDRGVRLVVTGMLNKQITAALGIGGKTVKVHRARVMEKMRAGSAAELVRLADEASVTAPKI
jgi:FixJ family two-component response regulator